MSAEMQRLPTIVEGYAISGGLPVPGRAIQRASFEDLTRAGLGRECLDRNLAAVLFDSPDQTVIAWSGESVVSPLQHLIGVFPHDGCRPVRTLDEADARLRHMLVCSFNTAADAVRETAADTGTAVTRTYLVQHIAPGEEYHDKLFRATFTQLHVHVIPQLHSYTQSQRIIAGTGAREYLREPENRHLYNDPFAGIAGDLFVHEFPEFSFSPDISSLVVTRAGQARLTDRDLSLMGNAMAFWKSAWREVGACFTDFATDGHGRYVPVPERERSQRVKDYVSRHPYLSDRSRQRLTALARMLKPSDDAPQWNGFYKGIAGSFVIAFDGTAVHMSINPRVYVGADKFVSSPYGDFLTIKDKTKRYPPEEERQIMGMQARIMDRYKRSFGVYL